MGCRIHHRYMVGLVMWSTIKRLFVLDSTGVPSATKFFSSIAYFVASWVIIRLTLNEHLTVDYYLVYLGVATGHSSFVKFLSTKNNAGKLEEDVPPPGSKKAE